MVLLVPHRRHDERLEALASRQALVSLRTVARVSRFDGRTHVVAIRTDQGWQRGVRLPWTLGTVEVLRGEVREVLLSRRLRRARVPLAWVPKEAYR